MLFVLPFTSKNKKKLVGKFELLYDMWKFAGSSTSDKNVMINTCDIFRPHLGLKVHEAVHYNSLRKNIFHLYLFQSGIWYAITKVWVKLWPPSSSSEWCSEQLFLEAWVTGDFFLTELCVMIYIMNDLHFYFAHYLFCLACRFGRKPMLLVSYISGMAFTLASIFSSSFIMFAVLRFFSGFTITGIVIVSSVLSKTPISGPQIMIECEYKTK